MVNFNLPNILTLLRISLIPIFIVCFYLSIPWGNWVAAAIFSVATITDWLDGYLARKLRQESDFGRFLDPVADKLIVVVALVLLAQRYHTPLIAIPAALIICREIVISALREWMAELGQRANVAVSWLGKCKTSAQMVAILLLLLLPPNGLFTPWGIAALSLTYTALGLTLWSMMCYLSAAWKQLSNPTPKK